MSPELVTTKADDQHYGQPETDWHTHPNTCTQTRTHTPRLSAEEPIPWPGLVVTFQLAAEDSLATRSPAMPSIWGYRSQTGRRMDGQNDGQADGPPRWLILRDEQGGVKSEHSDENNQERQWAVLSAELQYGRGEHMAVLCFSSLLALHLRLSSYISLIPFFKKK